MSDPVTIGAVVGAAGGALMNKKDPLKGMMQGASLGVMGGYAAPSVMGAMGMGSAATAEAGGLAAEAGMAQSAGLNPGFAYGPDVTSGAANIGLKQGGQIGFGGVDPGLLGSKSLGLAANGTPSQIAAASGGGLKGFLNNPYAMYGLKMMTPEQQQQQQGVPMGAAPVPMRQPYQPGTIMGTSLYSMNPYAMNKQRMPTWRG